jgi:hypothetical protein
VERPVGSDEDSGAICGAVGAGGAIIDCGLVDEVVGVEEAELPNEPDPLGLGATLRTLGAGLEERPTDERCASAGAKRKNVTSSIRRTFRIQGPRVSTGLIGKQTCEIIGSVRRSGIFEPPCSLPHC